MVHQCIRSFVIGSFLKRGHYLWSKYRFKLSPPNENATALFSVIVPMYLGYKIEFLPTTPTFHFLFECCSCWYTFIGRSFINWLYLCVGLWLVVHAPGNDRHAFFIEHVHCVYSHGNLMCSCQHDSFLLWLWRANAARVVSTVFIPKFINLLYLNSV